MNPLQMHRHPADKYTLTDTCNGETRTIACDDEGPWDGNDGPPAARDRLVTFVAIITDYIYSTADYKEMSPAVGGYD
jgi:hypothetical protein